MARGEANGYSPTWRAVFERRAEGRTGTEIAFLVRQLPLPEFRRVLDVACGTGRHAAALAQRGYAVTGIDRDAAALDEARRRVPESTFVEADMRELDAFPGDVDAVLCLWQSFGYFGDGANTDVLAAIARKLRPRGRLVLDVYDRAFFEAHGGTRVLDVEGRRVVERTSLRRRRLRVELDYGSGELDRFDWRLYTPTELVELAADVGLSPLVVCSRFDEVVRADASDPRVQLVFERHDVKRPAG